MNEIRIGALQRKARTIGLSDREADELGRLLAEAQGRPYSNATKEHVVTRTSDRMGRRRPGLARRRVSRRKGRHSLTRTGSIEIGLTSVPAEDAERQVESDTATKR